jgi:hypothetical protein
MEKLHKDLPKAKPPPEPESVERGTAATVKHHLYRLTEWKVRELRQSN